MKPKKWTERPWLNTYVREWICYFRKHDFQGWLAPPMPPLRLNGELPVWMWRCKRCGQEIVKYPDGTEIWL